MTDELMGMFAVSERHTYVLTMQTMHTSEKDAVLEQFCSYIPGVDKAGALFYLEANNWELQVLSYISPSSLMSRLHLQATLTVGVLLDANCVTRNQVTSGAAALTARICL
jgi:hypothetical protein